MNILVLNYEYPPIGGGGGVISKHIADGLAKLGHRVTVLTTEVPDSGLQVQRKKVWQGLYSKIYQTSGLADISYSLGLGAPDDSDILAFVETGETVQRKPDIKVQKHKGTEAQRHKGTKEYEFKDADKQSLEPGTWNPELIRLPSRRKNNFQSNPIEMLSWVNVTKRFLKNWDRIGEFDICYSHFALPGGEVALYLKKKFNLPYVVMSHGHDIPWVHPRQMFLFHLGAYSRLKSICKNSEVNLVQTVQMKANIDRFLGRKYESKNKIVPNGVDPKFEPDYSKRGHKLRILFIGRLVIQKNPLGFLEALKEFHQINKEYEVRILGDGSLRSSMEHYVKQNGLEQNVTFMGRLNPDEMLEEYQSAHLMVAPSMNEGMSIAAMEALGCGVCLIATRASGFPEMIAENINGDLVKSDDPKELAACITGYYQSKFKENYQVPRDFLKNFSEKYQWDKINRVYFEILSSVLDK